MAGNKKPRKRYNPKGRTILLNPLDYVIEGMTPLKEQASYVTNWGLQVHTSLDALLRGDGTPRDMSVMIGTQTLVAAMLAHLKRGTEYVDVLTDAHKAIVALAERFPSSKRYVCRYEEREALRMLVELLDAYIDEISVREMEVIRAIALKNMKAAVSHGALPLGCTKVPGLGVRI